MAYDEHLADRIRQSFQEKQTEVVEKNMMGRLCFMLNEKMCCGIHFDKKGQIDSQVPSLTLFAVMPNSQNHNRIG